MADEPNEVQLTYAALEKHNGSFNKAATELNISREEIQQRVQNHIPLRLKWGTSLLAGEQPDVEGSTHIQKVETLHSGLITNSSGLRNVIQWYEGRILTQSLSDEKRRGLLEDLAGLNKLYLSISQHVSGYGIDKDKVKAERDRKERKDKGGKHKPGGNGQPPSGDTETARRRPSFPPKLSPQSPPA